MSTPELLPSSEQGIEENRSLLDDFDRLLSSRSDTFARQRGAARVDDADFYSAYRDLLANEIRGWQYWLIRLVGSAFLLAGGIGISHSLANWSTTTSSPIVPMAMSCLCAVAGLGLSHFPFHFR